MILDAHAIPADINQVFVVYAGHETHPGNPSSALIPKCPLPRWFQRLEVFIRLEESLDAEGIDYSKDEDRYEQIYRDRAIGISIVAYRWCRFGHIGRHRLEDGPEECSLPKAQKLEFDRGTTSSWEN